MTTESQTQEETLEQIASRITRRWGSQYRTQLQTAIVDALRGRDERALRIIKEHRESDVCKDNCWTTISESIRKER